MKINIFTKKQHKTKEIKGFSYTETLLEAYFRRGGTEPVKVTPCGNNLILATESGNFSASVSHPFQSFLFTKANGVTGRYKNAFNYVLV